MRLTNKDANKCFIVHRDTRREEHAKLFKHPGPLTDERFTAGATCQPV